MKVLCTSAKLTEKSADKKNKNKENDDYYKLRVGRRIEPGKMRTLDLNFFKFDDKKMIGISSMRDE
jgi:hypothetical protein